MRTWSGILVLAAALAFVVPAVAAEEVKTDMPDGRVVFKSGDNSLAIGDYVQVRWTGDDKEQYDADTSGTGVGKADGFSDAFKVQKMRLILQGGMFKPWLKYKFEFELGDTTGGSSNKIKDAYVDFAAQPLASLRAGQYKAPFSLQQLTPDPKLQFVDRGITDAKFAVGRDQGVMLMGLGLGKTLGYSVGIFNGSGESKSQDAQGHLYVGRVWYDPLGEYKLSEGAIDDVSKPVVHVGLGARTGRVAKGLSDSNATPGVFQDPNNETACNVEFAWTLTRYYVEGEYFAMKDEQKNPTPGPDIKSTGYYVQGGVMPIPRMLDLGVRYAQIDPDRDVADDKVTEIRGVVGYYWRGHNLKVQADFGTIEWGRAFSSLSKLAQRNMPALGTVTAKAPATPQRLGGVKDYTDKQIRVQLQLSF